MPLTPAERFAALTPEEQAAILEPAVAAAVEPVPPVDAVSVDAFAELTDFYDDTLKLRHGGHDYVVHAVDVETGLMCQALVNLGLGTLTNYNLGARALRAQEGTEDTLDDSTEEALYQRLLGGDRDHLGDYYDPEFDVWQQLQDHRVSWPFVRHMGVSVLFWVGRDRTSALDYWLSGARPKAPEPQAESTRRKPRKKPADRRPSAKAGKGSGTR